jgi:excisionase family DNA binding protein
MTELSVPHALVLTVSDLAGLLRTSGRTLHRLNSGGRIPRPFRLGGQLRWSRVEVEAWVEAGMPDCRAWSRQWSATRQP